mmetsp:Transcript_186/g.320  ORF Transcript_186/g.320 Transcript_186/m.320 type:complete len:370 (-) Transcript_186:858-1967(-)
MPPPQGAYRPTRHRADPASILSHAPWPHDCATFLASAPPVQPQPSSACRTLIPRHSLVWVRSCRAKAPLRRDHKRSAPDSPCSFLSLAALLPLDQSLSLSLFLPELYHHHLDHHHYCFRPSFHLHRHLHFHHFLTAQVFPLNFPSRLHCSIRQAFHRPFALLDHLLHHACLLAHPLAGPVAAVHFRPLHPPHLHRRLLHFHLHVLYHHAFLCLCPSPCLLSVRACHQLHHPHLQAEAGLLSGHQLCHRADCPTALLSGHQLGHLLCHRADHLTRLPVDHLHQLQHHQLPYPSSLSLDFALRAPGVSDPFPSTNGHPRAIPTEHLHHRHPQASPCALALFALLRQAVARAPVGFVICGTLPSSGPGVTRR